MQNKSEKLVRWPKQAAPRDRLHRPLHDLRISVMDRCNFRCPYCMPEDKYHPKFRFLESHERLTFAEIVRLSRLFVSLGVHKIRITGGEPLLRPGLSDLIGDLSNVEGVEDVALTTNGVLLAQQAAALKAAGLTRVTVSLDSLDDTVFALMNGNRGSKKHVLDGIEAALEAGLRPVKINTVVQRGVNDDSVLDVLSHFRGTGVIVRFIEYMDVGNINHWRSADVVPSEELVRRVAKRWPIRPVEGNYHGEVARRYEYEDGQGEIGFVSSVTEPFCGACMRARLSSDGTLFTCLFASRGTDLKTALREGASDEKLLGLISGRWQRRDDRYSEQRASMRDTTSNKVEMYYIGG
ncbi:MAG: GTP 3',8-cyclase MoaA [Gammaproteobacteria bacterium]